MADRLARLRAWLAREGLDCAVVAGAVGVNHLLGYWRYFGGLAAAVVDHEGCVLVVPDYEEDTAGPLAAPSELRTYSAGGFGLVPDPAPLLAGALAQEARLAGASRAALACEAPALAAQLRERTGLEFTDASAVLARIRLVKDADELEKIDRAYRLAWLAQEAVRERAREGSAEIELFTGGQSAAQLAAGEPIEFLGDLLCGERTAAVCAPVRVASQAHARAGEAIVSDLVVGARGYWGDTAETLAVAGGNGGGSGTGEIAGVRSRLLEILAECSRLLRPGQSGEQVFAEMAARIGESFPGGSFPHHGGHGVGLGSFEDPHIVPGDGLAFEDGMVIALEPGVYFPGRFGARVERMYVVREDGGVEISSAVEGGTGPGRDG